MHASVVTEWAQACLQVTPRGTSHRQLKETSNGRSSQLNQYLSYKTNMECFEDFVCVLQMILWTKIKNLDVGLGLKTGSLLRIKQT